MRIDENSLIPAYQNRYRCRKKELIELLEYLILRKVYPLEEENKRLKENIHSMLSIDDVIQEKDKLKELLKEYKKQLSEIKNAYTDLTTQDEYGSYYMDEAKLFVEIVGKITKDFKTENE